ncbi:MAG: phospholipase D family protein [Aliidongia sp.]
MKHMSDVFSNSPNRDFVLKRFQVMLQSCSRANLAAPYFTKADDILGAAKAGKSINLLIGLNPSTSPQALKLVFGVPNITVRYFTGRFHAKIFIFDDHVLVGSSNLTEGGLFGNREATVCLNPQADFQRIEDLKAIFADLWNAAATLSEGILNTFRLTLDAMPKITGLERQVEQAVGRLLI